MKKRHSYQLSQLKRELHQRALNLKRRMKKPAAITGAGTVIHHA